LSSEPEEKKHNILVFHGTTKKTWGGRKGENKKQKRKSYQHDGGLTT